jgi:hypothetical protein
MTDRLSLANALADAKIDRAAAERIATEIFDAIHDSVATKADLERLESAARSDLERLETAMRSDLERLENATRSDLQAVRTELKADIAALRAEMAVRFTELEHRLTVRFASVMVVLMGLLFAALRYLPPAH